MNTTKTFTITLLFGLAVLPFGFQEQMPAWVFMWVLAFALYAASKVMTWATAVNGGHANNVYRQAGYLLLWPGMDPKPFLAEELKFPTPARNEWLWATTKTLFGATLIWAATPLLADTHWLLRAWVGMLGVIFLLHFGLFHLLALLWQQLHVPVKPLMENPVAATGLAEFWGQRWNRGFHDLIHKHLFRPVARKFGARAAMMTVFLASGLIHELVITVPAGGGYGLPTLYFLLQGLGVELERTKAGRKLGLGRGKRGWLFMFLITALPVGLLFPPVFLQNVILPMLNTIT